MTPPRGGARADLAAFLKPPPRRMRFSWCGSSRNRHGFLPRTIAGAAAGRFIRRRFYGRWAGLRRRIGMLMGFLNPRPTWAAWRDRPRRCRWLTFNRRAAGRASCWCPGLSRRAQMIEGYILTPRIMAGRTGLHPVAVIFAVFFSAPLAALPAWCWPFRSPPALNRLGAWRSRNTSAV